jgi:branched-subunit amino acid transport protein
VRTVTDVGLSPRLVWGIIIAIAIGTTLARVSFIVLLGRLGGVPPRLKRLLALVPPAALAALVFPTLLIADGEFALALSNTRLLAGGVAAVVAWRTGSLLATVVVGMAVFWGMTFAL